MQYIEIIVGTVIAAALLLCFFYFNNRSIVTTEYRIGASATGTGTEALRIAQVSDLQSRIFGKGQKNLLQKVKEANPDIIVITGDLVDRNFTNYEAAMQAVRGLSEIAEVLYVQGNHEQSLSADDYANFLGDAEKYMKILFNKRYEFKKCGKKYIFGGLSQAVIDESRGYNRDNRNHDEKIIIEAAEKIFDGAGKGFRILLAHEPQLFEIYAKTPCDLVLTGHAHGGQFRIPFIKKGIYSPEQGLFPKYFQGVHEKQREDGSRFEMVVSRGLGNSKFPIRLFNRPEIVFVSVSCVDFLF